MITIARKHRISTKERMRRLFSGSVHIPISDSGVSLYFSNIEGSGSYGVVFKGMQQGTATTLTVALKVFKPDEEEKMAMIESESESGSGSKKRKSQESPNDKTDEREYHEEAVRELKVIEKLKLVLGLTTSVSTFFIREIYSNQMIFGYTVGVAEFCFTTLRNAIVQPWKSAAKTYDGKVKILGQLLVALCAFKAASLVHLDLKPENILLTENDDVRVCDFGLVRDVVRFESSSRKFDAHMYQSVEYRSPEHMSSSNNLDIVLPEPSGTAADMWSLGCIAFFMFTTRVPFIVKKKEENQLAVIAQAHASGYMAQRATLVASGANADVIDFIMKTLAFAPTDRIGCADALRTHPLFSSHLETHAPLLTILDKR